MIWKLKRCKNVDHVYYHVFVLASGNAKERKKVLASCSGCKFFLLSLVWKWAIFEIVCKNKICQPFCSSTILLLHAFIKGCSFLRYYRKNLSSSQYGRTELMVTNWTQCHLQEHMLFNDMWCHDYSISMSCYWFDIYFFLFGPDLYNSKIFKVKSFLPCQPMHEAVNFKN